MKNFTIGSDPEALIINTKTNKLVSSIGLIPGEKGNPYRPEDLPEGFGLETDNVLVEFNIPPTPLYDEDAFVSNMIRMREWIRSFVKNIQPELDITHAASALFDDDQLQTKEAQEIGWIQPGNVNNITVTSLIR